MTVYPKYLTEYPNMYSSFPFHLAIHHFKNGFGSHRHDFLEASLVIEGEGTERINGVPHRVCPGTFTLVLPFQIHEIYPDPGGALKLYNCMFGMNILFDTNTDMGLREILLDAGNRCSPYVQLQGAEKAYMESVFETMLREYRGNHMWRNALLRSKIVEALVLFDRRRRERDETADGKPGRHLSAHPRNIWNIVHYVHQHYQEPLSLVELSGKFHMSPSHLSELFKKHVGSRFLEFLHELRIRHACGLLKSTEMSVSEIAMEVGYGSYKTFSRVFRERKGMTPTRYRNS